MDSATDLLAIARQMIRLHGARAAVTMEARAAANRALGEPEDAAFWAGVADAVRALEGDAEGTGGAAARCRSGMPGGDAACHDRPGPPPMSPAR